jgi:hypothetical protein
MEINPTDLRFSPYWHFAGKKLRATLNQLPEEAVSKSYPVIDDNQGFDIDTLVIGSIKAQNTYPETGVLSLTRLNYGISVVSLILAQPVGAIELRNLSLSGKPKRSKLYSEILSLAFCYTSWRSALFGLDGEDAVLERFDRTLSGAFASLALSRALNLRKTIKA